MLLKFVPVALVATVSFVSFATAQGRPPAELPPAGFSGQQYVDSRGCLYIRAGHGGQVNWVARIDASRRPICGQTPSASVMASAKRDLAAPVAAAPAPAPAQVAAAPKPVVGRPGAVPASSYTPPPVSYGAPTPLQRVQPAAPVQAAVAPTPVAPPAPVRAAPAQPVVSRTAGCPDFAPVGKVYELHRGGSMLVCANGPHRLTGLRPGDVERMAQIPPAPSSGYHVPRGKHQPHKVDGRMAEADLMKPPPGYKAAWRDDRLNPNRARGTAEGHQQMLQVWTDKVPQQLRDPAYARPKAAVSSKSVPAPKGVAGARFVQVGSFGVPENAARAASRLESLGMPVQISRASIKGKPVQVVKAGPFAGEGQVHAALQAARAAGFSDAILRR